MSYLFKKKLKHKEQEKKNTRKINK